MPKNLTTPVEIDTKLAEMYGQAAKLTAKRASALHTLLRMAGAKYYYRGRQRVTDMTAEQAIEKLSAHPDEYNLSSRQTNQEAIEAFAAAIAAIDDHAKAIAEIEALYTGWSRFFVVTSSNGHIHSSMHCHSCRYTTTYGWLPQLSGKSQDEAIQEFGPFAEALCSVCFPDAPVAERRTTLTVAEAEQLTKGERPLTAEAKRAAKAEAKRAKELAKLPRQQAEALKVNELFTEFGTTFPYEATYNSSLFGGKYTKGWTTAYNVYSDVVKAMARRSRH